MPTPTQRLNGLELSGIVNWQDISQEASGSFEGNSVFISSM
jgi:hypothetical protein